MKTTLSALLVISLATSCLAQKEISALKENTVVKAKTIQYSIKKLDGNQKKLVIDNTFNRLSNTKLSLSNLPLNTIYYGNMDIGQITRICADAISLPQIEEMLKTTNSSIYMDIKSSPEDNILEITFIVDKNSVLNLKQLEQIETNIKKQVRVTFDSGTIPFLKKNNFTLNSISIRFVNILKAKKGVSFNKRGLPIKVN